MTLDELLHSRALELNLTSAEALVESMSVEGYPYEEIPPEVWAEVKTFRKLRQDERLRRAEKALCLKV